MGVIRSFVFVVMSGFEGKAFAACGERVGGRILTTLPIPLRFGRVNYRLCTVSANRVFGSCRAAAQGFFFSPACLHGIWHDLVVGRELVDGGFWILRKVVMLESFHD
jgi:hypothetical protein